MDNLDSKISARVERDLPTSFFLITSDGRTLRLPIASRSNKDPLNWSKAKRAAAYTTLFMHSITLWVLLQIPFFTLPAIVARFGRRVSNVEFSKEIKSYADHPLECWTSTIRLCPDCTCAMRRAWGLLLGPINSSTWSTEFNAIVDTDCYTWTLVGIASQYVCTTSCCYWAIRVCGRLLHRSRSMLVGYTGIN